MTQRDIKPDPRIYAAECLRDDLLQFTRNGRWGTCGDCPRDSESRAYPEFCMSTERNDHQLDIDGLAFQFKNRVKDASR